MNSHHHFLSSLSIIIIFFFLFSVDVPISFADDEETEMERFNKCRTEKFNCGNQRGIGYPFWGNGRPNYCGPPGYKLDCVNGRTQIETMSTEYQILSINEESKTMRVAQSDFLDDACPTKFSNASQNFSLFSFPEADLDIFYGCPSVMPPVPNISYSFKCRTNTSTNDDAYFVPPSFEMRPQVVDILSKSCSVSVQIRIMESDWGTLIRNASTLGLVLRGGFQLNYSSAAAATFPFCDRCFGSGGECGFNSTLNQRTCFCGNTTTRGWTFCRAGAVNKEKFRSRLAIGIFSGVGGLMFIILCLWIVYYKNQRKIRGTIAKNVEQFLETYGCGSVQRYTYKDIKKMTNSFKDKLGEGGYGKVFKGELVDGRTVAVKLLINDSKKNTNGEDFMNEVATIGRTNHVNIVALLGFCSSGSKRALVYELMHNGSLEKFIYAKKETITTTTTTQTMETNTSSTIEAMHPLGWEKLYQIALGIARGLEYLHRGCNTGRILHFDIKPHNILLDENFCPKISDFGLAKLYPSRQSEISMFSGGRGTIGYIAPEVYNRNFGVVSYKSDVYSYGMMVLEMVGGRKNIDPFVENVSEIYFPHWIYNCIEKQKKKIEGLFIFEENFEAEIAKKMIMVGLWCIQTDQANRPSMGKVGEMLEGSIKVLQMPPNPFVDSCLPIHPQTT